MKHLKSEQNLAPKGLMALMLVFALSSVAMAMALLGAGLALGGCVALPQDAIIAPAEDAQLPVTMPDLSTTDASDSPDARGGTGDAAMPDSGSPPDLGQDMAASCTPGDGTCADGCTWIDDDDCAPCDGSTGMVTPMLPCSAERPCNDLLESYTNAMFTDPPLSEIDFPTFVPASCATTARGQNAGRPLYDDGAPIEWTDPDGLTRYHCEYRPPGTDASSKRPLLVVVHGSGGYATSVYDTMSYRSKAADYDLSGDPNRPGFIIVAPQGRNLHWLTATPQDGAKHDTFYRNLSSPSENRDIAYYDHLIDSLVAEGVADPDRIYMTGWSNGARFAAMYAIARHATATPGGNRVAAIANYSGGDPFSNGYHDQMPSCQAATYPTSDVPLLLYSRRCDAVPCNAAQDQEFRNDGTDTSPGNIAEDWIATLRNEVQNPNVEWRLLSGTGVETTEGNCTNPAFCGLITALVAHVRWPDGIGDNSGNDYEPAMLDFLRDNPL